MNPKVVAREGVASMRQTKKVCGRAGVHQKRYTDSLEGDFETNPCIPFHYITAGSAMYEHAMRLGQEVSGLDSLQKQVQLRFVIGSSTSFQNVYEIDFAEKNVTTSSKTVNGIKNTKHD